MGCDIFRKGIIYAMNKHTTLPHLFIHRFMDLEIMDTSINSYICLNYTKQTADVS